MVGRKAVLSAALARRWAPIIDETLRQRLQIAVDDFRRALDYSMARTAAEL